MQAAIYVHQTSGVKYADAIAEGYKHIETRGKDTLGHLVGKRVLIIRTQRGKPSAIVGTVTIICKRFYTVQELDTMRDLTLIPPGSKFDAKGRGKWCYFLDDATRFDKPVPLTDFTISHKTRSYCIISN